MIGQISRHLVTRCGKILVRNNVVSIEYVTRPMATDRHRDFLRNASADHIADCAPPEIVEQLTTELCSVTGGPPRFVKRAESLAASVVEDPFQPGILLVAFLPLMLKSIIHLSVDGKHPVLLILGIFSPNDNLAALQIDIGPAKGHHFSKPAACVISDHQGKSQIGRKLRQKPIVVVLFEETSPDVILGDLFDWRIVQH